MAEYETNERGNQITVRFPDAGKPKRWATAGETVPNGFVVSIMDMAGCDGGGSIMVEVKTHTPTTRRIEFIECHDDTDDETRGYAIERAGVRFYIGDDRV